MNPLAAPRELPPHYKRRTRLPCWRRPGPRRRGAGRGIIPARIRRRARTAITESPTRGPAAAHTPLPAATCRSPDIADIAVDHHFPLSFQDEKPYSNLHVSTTTPIRA